MRASNQNASVETVKQYLLDAYLVSPKQADALIEKHKDTVDQSIRLMSMAYYPGDRIAEAEKLTGNPDYEEDDDEEEDEE
jgi:hypothetical protein